MIVLPIGATVFTLAGAFGIPSSLPPMLQGAVVASNTVSPIVYNNWGIGTVTQLQQAAALLDTAMHATTGQKIVFGHSLGAVAACYWLAHYGPSTSISAADLQFVLIGNSVRPYGGFCFDINWFGTLTVPTNTPFQVYDIARQYDGWADFPTNSNNLTADYNALAGQGSVHPAYQNVNINDPNNSTYSVGNIHYIWNVTWPCPMLGTLQTASVVAQDEQLRPQIESVYSRPCGALNAPIYPT